jgi:hypothetical protein
MNKSAAFVAASVAVIVASTAEQSHAGGSESTIGIGAETQLNTVVSGVSLNYDAGRFHAGGLLGFSDQPGANNSIFQLGGRFYWRVHSTASSDFSVGGQFGYDNRKTPLAKSIDSLFLEPGFQVRAFISTNVALSFTGGLVIGVADADGFAVAGQLNASAGVHYYFF